MHGLTSADASSDARLIVGRGTDESAWRESPIDRLPPVDMAGWSTRRRIWIVSPHPDDEVLALGGFMTLLSALRAGVSIVSVTDGTASHRGSRRWSESRLAQARPAELSRALAHLQIDADVMRIGLPDGRLAAFQNELVSFLSARVTSDDLILATWRLDGHPDHEACGNAAAISAALIGATLAEYPVWMWHWARPGEPSIPWARARRIALGDREVARKRDAIKQFVSQVTPDEEREAVLPAHVISRFLRASEIVFV